jgi:hypothetical protein
MFIGGAKVINLQEAVPEDQVFEGLGKEDLL